MRNFQVLTIRIASFLSFMINTVEEDTDIPDPQTERKKIHKKKLGMGKICFPGWIPGNMIPNAHT